MIVATLLALTAATASTGECADPQTQFEMNACEYQRYEQADAALNAQWAETVAHMRERDRDSTTPRDGRPGFFETLQAGQRAWLTFRDKHCASEGYLMRGGTGEPLLINGCRATMTEKRTIQLKELTYEG